MSSVPTVNNFLSPTKTGLYCFAGDFYLDPKRGVHRALISHAHGDHAVAHNGNIYCTAPTESFMHERLGSNLFSQFHQVEYGRPFKINDVIVTFYPAGHMLGSAQILMEYQNERYLYTGDFKVQPDASCEPYQNVLCDHLVTETTFASPEYIHPNPAEEIFRLADRKVNVVVGAYAVGKAQRLTSMIAKLCPEIPLYVHPELITYHRIYEKHGFNLGEWKPYRRAEFKNEEQSFYIVSPSQFNRFSRNKNVLKVFATGWKQSYYQCDEVLNISDHADWNDLLQVVKNSGAKHVYTVHGDGNHLKNHLEGSNIGVTILS